MPEARGVPSGGANVMSSDRKDQPAEESSGATMPSGSGPAMKNIPKGATVLQSRHAATDGQTSGMAD